MGSDDICPRCDYRFGDLLPGGPLDSDPSPESPDDSAPRMPQTTEIDLNLSAVPVTDIVDAVEVPGSATGDPDEPGEAESSGDAIQVETVIGPAPDRAELPTTPVRMVPRAAPRFPPRPTGEDDAPPSPEAAEPAAEPAVEPAEALSQPDEEAPGDSADDQVALPESAETQPRLDDQLRKDAEPAIETGNMPTLRFTTREPRIRPAYIVPPAPYTPPPPVQIAPPPAYAPYGYAAPQVAPLAAGMAQETFHQRVQSYVQGGYRVQSHSAYEAALVCGKPLGVVGWLLALITGVGALWYLLILMLGGFQADTVYVVLESDGYVYEDGPGAAHVRRQRARTGQRWGAFGLIVFFVSLLLALVLGVIAGIALTQDRYQAALREAYPAVTLFEERFSNTPADSDDVSLAKDAAVAFAILAGISGVGLWGGVTLFVIGTIHARAYRTHVAPLPGYA